MKLHTQILSLGMVGVLLAALVGGVGFLNSNRMAGNLERAMQMTEASQVSQDADMMHDAVPPPRPTQRACPTS